MTLFVLIPLTALLGNVVLLGFTIAQESRDRNVVILLNGLPVAVSIWIGADVASFFSLGAKLEPIVCRIGAFGWILVFFGLLLFALGLMNVSKDILYWTLAGISGLVLGAGFSTDYIHVLPEGSFADLQNNSSAAAIWSGGIEGGPAAPLFIGMAVVIAVVFIGLIVREIKRGRHEYHRSVLVIVLIGTCIWLGLTFVVFVVLPAAFDLPGYSRFGSSLGVVMGFCVFWVIRQHNRTELKIGAMADELFDAVHEGIVITDLEGNVERISNQAKTILGVASETSENFNMRELLPVCDFEADFLGVESCLINHGHQRDLSVSQSALKIRGMEIAKLIIIRDLTERKKTARDLKNSRSKLNHEIEMRDARIERIEKNEALGTLAGGIAHDFNNLLSAILGFTTVVQDELDPDDPIQSDLKETLAAAMRTQEIVGHILSFCRQEEYDYERVDLRTVVEDAVGLLRVSLPSTVRLVYDPPGEALEAECARGELVQVILGLGTNADRAMGEGGGTISIFLEQTELNEEIKKEYPHVKPGIYAKLVLGDTGAGISKANLPRIFDPFFTMWKDTKPSGTGLGLSAAYGIIHAHGGAIDAESEVGVGTRFTVLLPLVEKH